MRRFVLFLIFFTFVCVLNASVFYMSRKSFGFESDTLSFSMDYGHLSFSYKWFSTGDIGNRGLVRTLSNLHSYSDFIPYIDKFNKKEQKRGFLLDLSTLKLFYLKNIVGLESSIGPFDFFYILKARELKTPGSTIDFKNSRDKSVMYFGGKFDIGVFSLSGITSFDGNGNFFSYLASRCGYWGAYIDLRLGNVFPIMQREDYDIFSLSLGLEKAEGRLSWFIAYGSEPIYTNTYMLRRSVKAVAIELGSAKLESKSERKFLSDGRTENSDKIAFTHDFLSIYYDSSTGLRHRVSFDNATIVIGKNTIGVEFDFPFSRDVLKVELELRGLEGFDVKTSIEFP